MMRRPKTGYAYRYAKALLSVLTPDQARLWKDHVDQMIKGLKVLLESGVFFIASKQMRTQTLIKVARAFDLPYLESFMYVVIKNDRVKNVRGILKAWKALYDEQQHIIPMIVTTAFATDKDRVKESLDLGHARFKVSFQSNAHILGGVIIELFDDVMIDASFRTKLNQLQNHLLRARWH